MIFQCPASCVEGKRGRKVLSKQNIVVAVNFFKPMDCLFRSSQGTVSFLIKVLDQADLVAYFLFQSGTTIKSLRSMVLFSSCKKRKRSEPSQKKKQQTNQNQKTEPKPKW
jgi:hypothetical protein